MIIAYNITATALNTFEEYMWNISQNIANANTSAYKGRVVQLENNFPFLLSDAITDLNDDGFDVQGRKKRVYEIGTGVRVADVTTDVSQGPIERTGRAYDLAVQGDGYFRFRRPSGKYAYGRAGAFERSKDGLLVDVYGNVLDPPIRIPADATDVSIDLQGQVRIKINNHDDDYVAGRVLLAVFPNPEQLQPVGQRLYVPTVASGEARLIQPFHKNAGKIIQESMESSNVNIVDQMMKLVVNQRSFQVSSKAFIVTDAILKAGM